MFQYCPSCASTHIQFDGRKFHCPDCAFAYYHNTAAASGCVIQAGETVLFLVRGKEPSLGKLDLPGGFADPGEGILEGLYRELGEELGWQPPIPAGASLADVFTLFASFPNVYPYKNIAYNTCDMFFSVQAAGLTEADLCLEAGEIAGARFLRLDEVRGEDLAFDSTRRAIQAFREREACGIQDTIIMNTKYCDKCIRIFGVSSLFQCNAMVSDCYDLNCWERLVRWSDGISEPAAG